MKTLILELADHADPLEESALRELASHYEPPPRQRETFPELSMWQSTALGLLVFIVWTPIAFWLSAGFPKPQLPPGPVVEQLSGFTPTSDGRWTARTYVFAPREDFSSGARKLVFEDDPVPLVVYEDKDQLPKENYEFQRINPANVWRFVTIKPSDGSDPSKGGHKYFAVKPY